MKMFDRTTMGNGACGMAALVILLLRLAAPTSYAQTGQNSDAPVQYDPIMSKRADLREKYSKSPQEGNVNKGGNGINRANLVTFQNLAAKRTDLRVRVAQVGLDRAYEEWSKK